MEYVVKYLHEIGLSAHLEKVPREQLKRLPMFLVDVYDYYYLDLNEYRLILAGCRKKGLNDPLQLKKQAELISRHLDGMIVVFVLKEYTLSIRRRLIKAQVNFVAPEEQLYLPDLLIDFRESIRQFRSYSRLLTPATQLMLLYHIQIESLEDRSFKEIAGVLEYTANTVSQAAKELKNKELCEITGTKEKYLLFRKDKKGLWNEAQPLMQSPIYKVFTLEAFQTGEYPVSHDNALSYYTDLSGSRENSIAISKAEYKYWKPKFAAYKSGDAQGDIVRLEVWKYDPGKLAKDGYVDPLSLYLCFRDDKNERVQGELPKLIEQVS